MLARINQYVERLRLPDTQIDVTPLMNKDSLEMTGEDREQILEAVRARIVDSPVVLTHGTDTMVETGRMLKARLGGLAFPVILTGAMTPLGFERSDGLQNLTESLFAARVLAVLDAREPQFAELIGGFEPSCFDEFGEGQAGGARHVAGA